MLQKYSHDKPDGTKETWEEIANRVANYLNIKDEEIN
jgi:hypothetical protein